MTPLCGGKGTEAGECKMSSNRADRIGMEIHRALAEVLREDISDPRVSTM